MIKLPFNIQRKNIVRSELLADIFKIVPERLPVIQELHHTTPQKKSGCCGFVLECNEFVDIEICKKIIAKNPKIVSRITNISEIDRSGLDFLIIKCLAECRISKDTIYAFLKTVPNSKVHERGYSYFQNSYDKVLKSLSNDAYYQYKNNVIRGGERTAKKDIKTKLIQESEVINDGEWKAYKVSLNEWESEGKSGKFLTIERHEAKPNSLDRANSKAWFRKQFLTISNKESLDKLLTEIEKIKKEI